MTVCGIPLYTLLWYFLIYSFIGWVVEVVFHAIRLHLVVNRGCLNGPVCPVYGFGVILVLISSRLLVSRFPNADGDIHKIPVIVLFILGIVLATLAELIGGIFLDRVFHIRFWDYSNQPLNYHGYICLKFSLIWGLLIVLVMRYLQPVLASHTPTLIPERWGWYVLAVLYLIFIADCIVSFITMHQLNKDLKKLDEMRARMRGVSDGITRMIGETTFRAEDMLSAQKEKMDDAADRVRSAADRMDVKLPPSLSEAMQKKAAATGEAGADPAKAYIQAHADDPNDINLKNLVETRDQYEKDYASWSAEYKKKGHAFLLRRVFRAYPDFRSISHSESLTQLRQILGLVDPSEQKQKKAS